ncbi:hypothetical protein FB45DRAFT_922424 [Roridomyces roridus]|uniref:Uncharacterized protein n=1 Tax=Roridomyces roridus TaxID=1738132 RepID=A0AAD7FIA1_9AGAR|nr:hypothetical protein FB45DRAFT_922424 [Roridomyces roridus]
MMSITDASVRVNFITLIVASLLYGIVLLLFVSNIYFLATRRTLAGKTSLKETEFHHWILVVFRGYLAFIVLGNPDSESNFYNHGSLVSGPTQPVLHTIFVVSIMLGDLLLNYRLWVIWGGNRKIMVVPTCTVIGATVGSIVAVSQKPQLLPGPTAVGTTSMAFWSSFACVCPIQVALVWLALETIYTALVSQLFRLRSSIA